MTVSEVIRTAILQRLAALEERESIRILYACESGSRAWGIASDDSDYDVRFIYIRSAADYLRLIAPRDVIEEPIEGDLDINGWDIYKALHLFRKTNPPLLEWLDSPIVYLDRHSFASRLSDIAARYFNVRACCEHYLSMACNNYDAYITDRDLVKRKKYLYAMRPLVCIHSVLNRNAMAPTAFAEALDEAQLPNQVQTEVHALLTEKAAGNELSTMPPNATLDAYIVQQLEQLRQVLNELPGIQIPTDELDMLVADMLQC